MRIETRQLNALRSGIPTLEFLFLKIEEILEIEALYNLPRTGNVYSLFRNYIRNYYSYHCEQLFPLNHCLALATQESEYEAIEDFLKKGATNYHRALVYASKCGNIELIEKFYNLILYNDNTYPKEERSRGYNPLYFIKDTNYRLLAIDITSAIKIANNLKTLHYLEDLLKHVQDLINKSPEQFEDEFDDEDRNEHRKLEYDRWQQYNISNAHKDLFLNALVTGNNEIIDYIESTNNDEIKSYMEYDNFIIHASRGGHVDLINKYIQKIKEEKRKMANRDMEIRYHDFIITNSCRGGHVELAMDYLIKYKKNIIPKEELSYRIIDNAICYGHSYFLNYFEKELQSTSNYIPFLLAVGDYGYLDLLIYFENKLLNQGADITYKIWVTVHERCNYNYRRHKREQQSNHIIFIEKDKALINYKEVLDYCQEKMKYKSAIETSKTSEIDFKEYNGCSTIRDCSILLN